MMGADVQSSQVPSSQVPSSQVQSTEVHSTEVHSTEVRSTGVMPITDIDPRLKLSALWVSLLLVFVFTDLFSLYRPDIRMDLARGELAGFPVGRGFMLGIVLYVLPAALTVCGSVILQLRISRIVHLVLAPIYAITIVASAVGEWSYYVLASVVELLLLIAIFRLAWSSTELVSPRTTDARDLSNA